MLLASRRRRMEPESSPLVGAFWQVTDALPGLTQEPRKYFQYFPSFCTYSTYDPG